ncbi:MAG: protein kinase [Planctomycetes bacterium]|nr:protein kinase [Planctomycetota bacterium]
MHEEIYEYELRPGWLRVDPEVIRERLKQLGFTNDADFCKKIRILQRQTFQRRLREAQFPPDELEAIAKELGIEMECFFPKTKSQRARQSLPQAPAPHDWKITEVIAVGCKAANGVAYEIYKLESTLVSKMLARGKFYRLEGVRSCDREELIHRLERHPRICETLNSPFIAQHRTTIAFDGSLAWWTLDRWVEGKPLDQLTEDGVQFSLNEIYSMGEQILHGLAELHRHGIIARELAPEKIIVDESRTSTTITDFEMAKIMEQGVPSVSGRWKSLSPYRAPEVIDDIDQPSKFSLGFRSDIFSWGVIMIELLTGATDCTPSKVEARIENKDLANFLLRCTHKAATKRPESVDQVIAEWRKLV